MSRYKTAWLGLFALLASSGAWAGFEHSITVTRAGEPQAGARVELLLAGEPVLRVRDNDRLDRDERPGVIRLALDGRHRQQTATVTVAAGDVSRTTAIVLAENSRVDVNGEQSGGGVSRARADGPSGLLWGAYLARYFGSVGTELQQAGSFPAQKGSAMRPSANMLGASVYWRRPFPNLVSLGLGMTFGFAVGDTLARALGVDLHPPYGAADTYLGYEFLWRFNPYLSYQVTRVGMNAAPIGLAFLLGLHVTAMNQQAIADESGGGGMRNSLSERRTLWGPSLGLGLFYRMANDMLMIHGLLMFDYIAAQSMDFRTTPFALDYAMRAQAAWLPVFMLNLVKPF